VNLAGLITEHDTEARALYDAGAWHTWGAVRRRVGALSRALLEHGVAPDDRVAIVWPTSVDFTVGATSLSR